MFVLSRNYHSYGNGLCFVFVKDVSGYLFQFRGNLLKFCDGRHLVWNRLTDNEAVGVV